jgi:hypothetical protein
MKLKLWGILVVSVGVIAFVGVSVQAQGVKREKDLSCNCYWVKADGSPATVSTTANSKLVLPLTGAGSEAEYWKGFDRREDVRARSRHERNRVEYRPASRSRRTQNYRARDWRYNDSYGNHNRVYRDDGFRMGKVRVSIIINRRDDNWRRRGDYRQRRSRGRYNERWGW